MTETNVDRGRRWRGDLRSASVQETHFEKRKYEQAKLLHGTSREFRRVPDVPSYLHMRKILEK